MKYRYFVAFIQNGSYHSMIVESCKTKEEFITNLIREDKCVLNCIQFK